MRQSWTWISGFLLLVLCRPVSAAPATALRGYVDQLSAQSTTGWVCISGSTQTVAVSVFAGATLLGTFPAQSDRPDLGTLCGSGNTAHGFGIWFDPIMQAQFVGKTMLRVVAAISGQQPVTLPASNPRGTNPAIIPSGAVAYFDQDGNLTGRINFGRGKQPIVRIYSGGPAAGGGIPWGDIALQPMGPYSARFVASPTLAGSGPLFAYADDQSGALIPLLGVPPATAAELASTNVAFSGTVAQSGNRSGITNTLFTTWIATPQNFGGVSGSIAFSGNAPAFSEALVTLGTTTDLETACIARNGSWPAAAPTLTKLWVAILKSTSGPGTAVTLPVNFGLPFADPLSPNHQGVCLAALVSAGYPYLDPNTARYSLTKLNLSVSLTPNLESDPRVFALGLGGEFKFRTGGAQPLSTFVGLQASKPLLVDGIAGAVSISAVQGAPVGSGWLPVPSGLWTFATSFEYFPASLCARSGFIVQPSNGVFSIIRQATPALFSMPAGATSVLELPLSGAAAIPLQLSAFQGFFNPLSPALPRLQLATGDCLIAFHTMQPSPGQLPGSIDYENQSSVYMRFAQ